MIKTPRQRYAEYEAEIARLKARVAELEPDAEKWNNVLKAKRNLHERRRELLKFVHYKSFYQVPRRFWPETLCHECAHCIPDGRTGPRNPNRVQLKCTKIGTRVGKYGACDWAQPDPKTTKERSV